MPLAARHNLRTPTPRFNIVFTCSLFFASLGAAHADPIRDGESASLNTIAAFANGEGNAKVQTVMAAYDALMAQEQALLQRLKTNNFAKDAKAQQEQESFYHKRAIEKGLVSTALGGDFYSHGSGIAKLMSASIERVMPYAHIVLPGNDLLAYEVIDIATFGAENLSGAEMGAMQKRIVAKQHVNEGPINENGRPAGRDVVVLIIDSRLNDADAEKSLGDRRILAAQGAEKPQPRTKEWNRAFIRGNVEKPTRQEKIFGHGCGLAQAGIAVCMSVAMNKLGMDNDGAIDIFPAVLSYGFGTVVGIYSRTYQNVAQWGNERDRLRKTSVIGYLFAYTLTTLNGIDPLIYETFSNPHLGLVGDYAHLLTHGLGSLVGTAGVVAAAATHFHIVLNNKLSNWAKINFHTFNLTQNRAGISTKPLMIPENLSRRSAAFILLGVESIAATIVKPFVPQSKQKHMSEILRSVSSSIIQKLPKNRGVVTTLEQGAVSYQGVYIFGHFPFKMFDLIPHKSPIPLSKMLLVAVTPVVKYLNLVYSRTTLRSLEVSASPMVEEFRKHHDKLEKNWKEFLIACLPQNLLKNGALAVAHTVKDGAALVTGVAKLAYRTARATPDAYVWANVHSEHRLNQVAKLATPACAALIQRIVGSSFTPTL